MKVEFYLETFDSRVIHLILSTISHPARQVSRTLPPPCPLAAPLFVAPPIPAMPLYPWRESHDSCLPVRAGSKLNMPAVHPQRATSSLCVTGAPRCTNRQFCPHGRVRRSLPPTVDRAAFESPSSATHHLGRV